MKNNLEQIQIYFTKLFTSIILKNEIVATIIYNISLQISDFDVKMKQKLNKDI
jgi:hypothetical protein